MPCFQELSAMLGYVTLEPAEFVSTESYRGIQGYRIQPEFGDGTNLLHVDVRRLRPFVAVEEESGHRSDER